MYRDIALFHALEQGNAGNARAKDSNKVKEAVDYLLQYV